jgi:dolichol-phosphate mannosyltransferase
MNIDISKNSDFKLLDRKAVDVLLSMPEKHMFFKATSSWIGFKTAYVEYDVKERLVGELKWSTLSLVKYALHNITSFSTAPIQIVTVTVVIFLLFYLILGAQSVYQKIVGNSLAGFTTVILLLLAKA